MIPIKQSRYFMQCFAFLPTTPHQCFICFCAIYPGVFVSFTTLLLFNKGMNCCIDWLKSQLKRTLVTQLMKLSNTGLRQLFRRAIFALRVCYSERASYSDGTSGSQL